MDRPTITAAVKAELDNYQLAGGEFPPCSEDYLPELGQVLPQYPDPVPAVLRFRPLKLANPPPCELIVTGQSFSRAPDAIVKIVAKGTANALAVNSTLFGTFRCSRLRAVVAPPGMTNAIAPGMYTVQVVNSPGTPKERVLTASLDLEIA